MHYMIMVRAFANGSGRPGFNPMSKHIKDFKNVN